MKRFAEFVVIAAALVAAPLPAQSMRLRATIPFEFWVGSQRMPAGEYALESGGLPGALYLTKSDQRAYTFVVSNRSVEPSGDRSGEGKLVFHRYGNDYFLREIRDGTRSVVNRLFMPIEERRLLSGPSAPGFQRVSIQAAAM